MSPTRRRFRERGSRCPSRRLPIIPVAFAALALAFLCVPEPAFAGDQGGQPAGLFVSTESPADEPVAPLPPAASPDSPNGNERLDLYAWWLLPLGAGLAGLGGLLVALDRRRCFDQLD